MDGMDSHTAHAFLESLFRSAVAAAHPDGLLPPNLPEPPARGRLVILAAGKAAGAMTRSRGTALSGAAAAATARRARGHPPRLWAADALAFRSSRPATRYRTSRRHLDDQTGARHSPTRSTPTTWSWCCFPAAPRRTGSRRSAGLTLAEKQAVTRALLEERRRDRRDEYRAQASLAHQGRAARRARLSGRSRRRWRSPTCPATTRR